ncbi:unnamed protein product [Malus baccata var. baccata]
MSDSSNVRSKSCELDCSVEEVDLESGLLEVKKVVHLSKVERNCRICHLGLEGGGGTALPLGSRLTWGVLARGIWVLLISNVLRLGSRSREILYFRRRVTDGRQITYPDSSSRPLSNSQVSFYKFVAKFPQFQIKETVTTVFRPIFSTQEV